jgi:hypothetical protein
MMGEEEERIRKEKKKRRSCFSFYSLHIIVGGLGQHTQI